MLEQLSFALQGAWKVLAASLLLGAGLPAVFALGVRFLALGTGGDAEVDGAAPRPVGKLLAGVCFAAVLLAIALGITIIVAGGFGKSVSFENIIPTLVDKK